MDIWRLLEPVRLAGRFQMAIDDGLARQSQSHPILRFYSWQPPAISLGYHQREDSVLQANCRADSIDVVRRPTGGRAILHAEELTYAVIIPRDSQIASGSVHDVHNRISQALAAGLQSAGFNVTLNREAVNLRAHYQNNPGKLACFTATTQYELQIGGKKVVGSAQRQYQSNILQHGSILIGDGHRSIGRYLSDSEENRSRLSRELRDKTAELENYSGISWSPNILMEHVISGFTTQFNIRWQRDTLSDPERQEFFSCTNRYEIFTSDHESVSTL